VLPGKVGFRVRKVPVPAVVVIFPVLARFLGAKEVNMGGQSGDFNDRHAV
jgi:hypothetical protein